MASCCSHAYTMENAPAPAGRPGGISMVEACYAMLKSIHDNLEPISTNQHKLFENQLKLRQDQVNLQDKDAEIAATLKMVQDVARQPVHSALVECQQGLQTLSSQVQGLESHIKESSDVQPSKQTLFAHEAIASAADGLRTAMAEMSEIRAQNSALTGVLRTAMGEMSEIRGQISDFMRHGYDAPHMSSGSSPGIATEESSLVKGQAQKGSSDKRNRAERYNLRQRN